MHTHNVLHDAAKLLTDHGFAASLAKAQSLHGEQTCAVTLCQVQLHRANDIALHSTPCVWPTGGGSRPSGLAPGAVGLAAVGLYAVAPAPSCCAVKQLPLLHQHPGLAPCSSSCRRIPAVVLSDTSRSCGSPTLWDTQWDRTTAGSGVTTGLPPTGENPICTQLLYCPAVGPALWESLNSHC